MPVPVFCCFWFQKGCSGNILGIRRNEDPTSYFSRNLPESQRGTRGGPQGAHTCGWRGQEGGRAPLLCGGSVTPPTLPLRLFKGPWPKSSRRKSHGTRNLPEPPPSRSQDLGDRSLCSGTPPGRGSAPGRLLHRHRCHLHRHLHQRCCLPWGGSSSPSRLGAVPVAMWFISLLCTSIQ